LWTPAATVRYKYIAPVKELGIGIGCHHFSENSFQNLWQRPVIYCVASSTCTMRICTSEKRKNKNYIYLRDGRITLPRPNKKKPVSGRFISRLVRG
jgi:hypothetical protein